MVAPEIPGTIEKMLIIYFFLGTYLMDVTSNWRAFGTILRRTSVADYLERKAINSNRVMPFRLYHAEAYGSGREEPWFGSVSNNCFHE
jgi:hypothetical protein